MKFQKLESFEKHFKQALPQYVSAIYGVIAPKESERKKICGTLIYLVSRYCDFKRCDELTEAIGHLNTRSFLSSKVGAYCAGIDHLSKREEALLMGYVRNPNPEGFFLFSAEKGKTIEPFYKQGKKEMVILDLSKEKPWEEKNRLRNWVLQSFKAKGKGIEPAALDSLLERFGKDRLLLGQEMEKLICYLGVRERVNLLDVEQLCGDSEEETLFQIARTIVWKREPPTYPISDLSILLPLIGQLRFQLEMGLKMSALLKTKTPFGDISKAFPSLYPKVLNECLEQVARRGEQPFAKGLCQLFSLEYGLKTQRGRPHVLFSQFCGRVV